MIVDGAPISRDAFQETGMKPPVKYDYLEPLSFGGTLPEPATFETAKAVILPVPFESTTSYVNGTRNGPREILVASSHMELWDEEDERRRSLRSAFSRCRRWNCRSTTWST